MSVYHPYSVQCKCGTTITVNLADSINATRAPQARERILGGTLHRANCPKCRHAITIEKPFFYSDFKNNVLIKILPSGQRHHWREASRKLDELASQLPRALMPSKSQALRVVFGLDELREKLIAQDHGLDDRMVELLKVFVLAEHPFLAKRPRLRLSLEQVRAESLVFLAAYEHDNRAFRISMPRWISDPLLQKPDQLQKWETAAAKQQSLFADPSSHWINLWRFSPQPDGLAQLHAYAADVSAGKDIDVTSQAFKLMLQSIPRGGQLPPQAKQDIQVIFDYARKKELDDLEKQLMEIRFGFSLEDDWALNSDKNDISALWRLLKDLPPSNVEGNTAIHEIFLDEGEGGGFYQPSTYDIHLGDAELGDAQSFENLVKHEVGHSVQEALDNTVTPWLTSRFGWQMFPATNAGIDQWIQLMGGWPADVNTTQRAQIYGYLLTALGNGSSWVPGPAPTAPPGHPWNRSDFGARLAFENTGANWYRNYQTWYRNGPNAFFMNYWYCTFVAVSSATLELVDKMPSNYASMSPSEFFAELYALYYDEDDDRSGIPVDVNTWMRQNIGPRTEEPPPAPSTTAAPAAPERLSLLGIGSRARQKNPRAWCCWYSIHQLDPHHPRQLDGAAVARIIVIPIATPRELELTLAGFRRRVHFHVLAHAVNARHVAAIPDLAEDGIGEGHYFAGGMAPHSGQRSGVARRS